jgi:RNA polymerase sigma-70 factor, ECF subfamily
VAVKEPSNDQWLAALRGPNRDEALAELRVVLMRGLRAALGGQANRVESSVEDFAQEALIKILDNLDSFRGECHFTTWAQKICVRTAFAEMRRSRWREVSLDELITQPEGSAAADPQLDPERTATQTMIMETFQRFIDEGVNKGKKRRAGVLGPGPYHLVGLTPPNPSRPCATGPLWHHLGTGRCGR